MPRRVIETVGDLKKALSIWPDDWRIDVEDSLGVPLGTPLTFYRLKQRGDDLVVLELQELYEPEEWEEIKRRRRRGLPVDPES